MNGEADIRPCRIAIRSGSLVAACSLSNDTRSGRSGDGCQSAWLARGVFSRADFPRAIRSSAESFRSRAIVFFASVAPSAFTMLTP